MTTTIHPIHTNCKNCVFAKYENNTQTSCHMEMIAKYREQDNSCVLEVYDEEKEFYVINQKKCLGYKENKYFIKRDMENATIEEKIDHIKKTWSIKYLSVIDCRNKNRYDLERILSKLKNSNVVPTHVLIITHRNNNTDHQDFYKVLNKSGLKWTIKSLQYPDQDQIVTVHQIINEGAKNCNFLLSVGEDDSKIDEIINIGNSMIYEERKSFMVISNKSKQSILFSVLVYKNGLLPEHEDIITNYEAYTIL
jgi:hypothetical protein